MINRISQSSPPAPTGTSETAAAVPAEADAALRLETFKQEFYTDAARVVRHPTVINSALQISDAAFEAMQADPAYRQQMLDLIARDLGGSYAPRPASVLIRIGATADEYRADSWPVGYDQEYHARVRDEGRTQKKEGALQQQKEFQARRRAEYRVQQLAMQANALKHSADSAWLRQQPGSSGPRQIESYLQNSTTAVFEGFSLWEGPAPTEI